MATELNPPNSDAVIVAADESVELYKAAGFTEAKTAKRSTAKSEK